ncbi:MAG: hypothetical protein AB1439_04900 [candidate division FCPU426 bacterium]
MSEEGSITMTEFKTVVEEFRSDIKKVVEVMNHRFDKVDERLGQVEGDVRSLKHEVAVLHLGQTELKGQFTEMRKDQAELRGQFAEMRKDQAVMNGQLVLLHQGQTEIKAELRRKADAEDLAGLDLRVAGLENRIA